jgi:DNA-binding beta-propeller fold protein YncE
VASLVVSIRSFSRISAAAGLLAFLGALGGAARGQTAQFLGAQIALPIGTLNRPYGVAVDAEGNIYVADNAANTLSKLTPSGSLVSGSSFLTGDGSPYGIAVDAAGNLYVTDEVKNEVVKETLQPGGYYKETVLPFKGLNSPLGIAVDAQGNLYVADAGNNRVLKGTPFGSTYTQSLVPTSALSYPEGVAVDAAGNLYVADSHHLRVVKEVPSASDWSESTVAYLENYGTTPIGVAADAAGDVFILSYMSNVDFVVVKATLANGAYTLGILDSEQAPYGIAANAAGDVFLASPGTNELLKVFAGPANFGGVEVPTASSAITLKFEFDTQSTIGAPAVATQGIPALDFADAGTGSCTTQGSTFVYNTGDTCTVDVTFTPQFPGSKYGAVILQDGSGDPLASAYVYGTGVSPYAIFPPGQPVTVTKNLVHPSGVAVDEGGEVIVADSSTGSIYKGTILLSSGLTNPIGVALDGAGNVYVLTPNLIYKEAPIRGAYVQSRVFTSLTGMSGIAVDRAGNLYFTSPSLGAVHKETLQSNGTYVESAIGSGFSTPNGVAVDGSGNVFIVDTKNDNLVIETLEANATYVQTTFALGLPEPQGVAVDGVGNLYVTDSTDGEIDMLTRQTNGSYIETAARSGLPAVAGVAVDQEENLYYSQTTGLVTKVNLFPVASLYMPTTKPGSSSTGSQALTNVGNAALVFRVPAYVGSPFSFNADSTCPTAGNSELESTLDPGQSCVYEIVFIPPYRASFYQVAEMEMNSLNASIGSDGWIFNVYGTASTSDTTRTTMRASPNPVQVGLGVTITVTVVDTDNAATIPQGEIGLTDTVGGQVIPLNGGAAVTLNNGKATLTMVPSVAGAHIITAHYGGVNNSFIASTGTASLTVQQ